MPKFLLICCWWIDRVIDFFGRTVAWLAPLMVVTMVTIVVLRYGFETGSIALQESVLYLNALVFAIGAAFTLKERAHVSVDIIYRTLSPRRQALIDLVGTLIFLLPTTLFILLTSLDYVGLSWRIRETSTEASGLPYVYLLKSCILLLVGLLSLQGLSELIKAGHRLFDSDVR